MRPIRQTRPSALFDTSSLAKADATTETTIDPLAPVSPGKNITSRGASSVRLESPVISWGPLDTAGTGIPKLDRRNALFSIGLSALATLPVLQSFGSTQAFGAQRPAKPSPLAPSASDTVTVDFEVNGKTFRATGELVGENQKYGHLILDGDGVLTAVAPEELKGIKNNAAKLEITPAKELGDKQLAFMPANSKILCTEHFVVCYNTTDSYARWNADLYENLFRGFYRFWKGKGLDLKEPRFPLVALVFETKTDYVNFASQEFEAAEATFGYYHQETNRLASYDLTGIEGMLPAGVRINRGMLVQEILARPEAERTVATVIHEACHQLAFNSGLQTRLGANPLWLSEGLAMFFETPDLGTKSGWRKAGTTNYHNLYIFKGHLPHRSEDSLTLLLADDDRLLSADSRTHGYAEAWALTHYLLQNKSKEFVVYLREVKEIAVGTKLSAKERIDLFCKCFGQDLAKIDRDMIRHVQRLR